MTRTVTARSTIVVAIIVVASVAAVPLGTVGVAADESDDPETADDYFETFRAMEGTDAYEEYDEFETIRTFALSQTQEIGTLDDDDRAELAAVLETMRAFERAYEHADAGEFEESLAAAETVEDHVETLETHEQTQATLADLALTRFYERLGDGLRADAEATDRTPERIELLSMTATAYERANMPDEAAEFNLQVEQQTAAYEAALERIDDAEDDAETFLETCTDCTDVGATIAGSANPLETFERYQRVQGVNAALGDAEDEAAAHGLEGREGDLEAIGDDVGSARLSLALASVSVLVGYGFVVGLVGTIVSGQIFAWHRTYDDAQIGSVVTVGESDV